MGEVADLYVTLRAYTGQFKTAMTDAALVGEMAGAKIRKGLATTGLLVGGSLLAGGVAAVKMASDFQASMTRINSLALGGKGNMNQLSQGVLNLAGQVGFSPGSLADALYHIESAFAGMHMSGKQALDALRLAAEGAQVGGASLIDTTNSLNAAIASGVTGVHGWQQAMGALFATVGSGDMTMQNLNEALSTGILAIGKIFGVTMQDNAAALATFGDNLLRGAKAGTEMRMAVMDLAVQSKKGIGVLQGIGIKSGELGAVMRKSGFIAALGDLRNHLIAMKIPMTEWGQISAEAFTKKSAAPLAIMLSQFDRLKGKLDVVRGGINGFGAAWQARLHTAAQQWDNLKATLEAGLIKIGTALLPYVIKAMEALNTAFTWLGKHKDVLYALAGGAAALVGVGLAAWVVDLINPFTLIVTTIFAVGAGLTYLYEHSKTFRTVVNDLGHALTNGLGAAFRWLATYVFPLVKSSWSNVMAFFSQTFSQLAGWWHQNSAEIMQVVSMAWGWIKTYIGVQLAIVVKGVQVFWPIVKALFTQALHFLENITAIGLDLITGHWKKLWHDVGHLITQGFSDAWNVFTTSMSHLGGLLVSALTTLAGKFVSWVAGLVSDAVQWGIDIIHGLENGLQQGASGLGHVMAGIANGLTGGLTGMLGIHSPSTVFHQFGIWIVQGLVNGINASGALVSAAMTKLGTLVKNTYTKKGKLHQSWVPEHQFITGLEHSFTVDFRNLTHARDQISKWANEKQHRNPAGQRQALAAWRGLHADLEEVLHQVERARTMILHDPHATAGERRRINTQFGEVLKQLARANELHTKLLNEQVTAHKAVTKARRESARKAIAGDQVTYLAATAAAGWTTHGSGLGVVGAHMPAPPPQTVVNHIHVTVDGKKVTEVVQKHLVRAERRNTSNLTSARRGAKR